MGVEMYGSSPESIQTFATEFRVDYRLLVGSDIVGDLYSVGGLPTNYYINRKGMLVHATEGATPEADMEAFIQQARLNNPTKFDTPNFRRHRLVVSTRSVLRHGFDCVNLLCDRGTNRALISE